MILIMLSISDINQSLAHILELMIMFFGPIIGLVMIYVTIGRPMLRTLHRARLNEQERQLENKKFLRYKFDNKYNHQSTRVGEEAQQLSDIKKEV